MRRYLTSSVSLLACGLLGACVLCGCPDFDILWPCIDPGPPPVDVDAAVDTLEVNGQHYELQCALWRDFMPPSPLCGKPLTASIRLTEVDQLDIDPGIDMTYLWILNGCQVWETEFSDEERPAQPAYQIERIARSGPTWGPSITVDVVVQVVDGDGNTYLVRSCDVVIGYTM